MLILDEVVTGFRYAPGGCQEHYGVQPDISTFGKALGAGFPVGAVAGPRSILERMRWSENMVLHYGTFNGHRLTMKVGCGESGSAHRRTYLSQSSRGGQRRHCRTPRSISPATDKGNRARLRTHVPDLFHRT